MRTIVVGVDGSDASIRALRFAAGLVGDLAEAKMIVAHARHLPGLWGPEHVAEKEFSDVLDRTEQRVRETRNASSTHTTSHGRSKIVKVNLHGHCATSLTPRMRAFSSSATATGQSLESCYSVRFRIGSRINPTYPCCSFARRAQDRA